MDVNKRARWTVRRAFADSFVLPLLSQSRLAFWLHGLRILEFWKRQNEFEFDETFLNRSLTA
jgi:hypothetical protein